MGCANKMFIVFILLLIGIASSSTVSFQPSPTIQIISQTYLDTYLSWKFTQIDEKTWTATFTIDPSFLTDIKNCTSKAGVEKTTCFSNLCTIYSKNSNGSTVFNCTAEKTKLQIDLLNLTNYPVKSLTSGISFGNVVVDMAKGSGTFTINFPDGFKTGESAKFGFGTTIINTTTDTYGRPISMLGSQYKSYFAAGLFWAWYDNGTNITYSVSTDGVTFINKTAVRPCATAGDNGGYDFSVWYNGTYVSYAYNDRSTANTPLFYRRGTPNADGTITWSAEEQTVFAGAASRYWRYPSVITDDQGYPWITYVNSTTSFYPWVVKSSTNDGTWATQFATLLSSTTSGSWSMHIAPLTTGKIIVAYSYASLNGKVRTWDGAAWNAELTTSNLCITNGYCLSMVAEGNNAHIAMLGTDSKIYYFNYTYDTNTLSSEQVLFTGIADSYPHLTYNGTGGLYLFYWNTPDANHVYYRTKNQANAWSGATDWLTITNLNVGQNDLAQFYQNYSYYIGVMAVNNYTVGTYNITFDFLNYTPAATYNPFFNVTWNYPANNTWNATTQDIKHYFTPLWYDNTIDSVSLWTNKTGTFALAVANSSPVTNNVMGYLQYNYGADSSLIYAYFNITNSTGDSNFTANFTIKIDTVKPSTAATGTDDSSNPYTYGIWSPSAYIDTTLVCTDATSGCLVTKYCTDVPNTCTPSSTYSTAVRVSTTGTSYIRYNSTDNAGSVETVQSKAIMIDTDLPTTTPTATKDDSSPYTFNTWAKTAYVDVTLTGADATSGLSNTKYCADTSNTCTPATIVMAPVHVTTQGTSYVRYYSTDNAGNTETVTNQIVKIDSTAPATTATAVNNDSTPYTFGTWTASLQIYVTLACSDTGGSGCFITYYCLDVINTCTPNTQYTGAVEVTTKGSSFIRFNSTDNVGNYGVIQSKHIMIDPDYSPPGEPVNYTIQPFPNMTNITSYEGLIPFADSVTEGWYSPVLSITMFFIVFFALAAYPKEKGAVVASFFALITVIFLWLMGASVGMYIGIWTAILIGTSLIMIKTGRN
jgi:hypothetical protein